MRREKRQKHSQGKVTATQSAASMVTQHGTNPDVQISPALSPIIGSNSISGTGYTGTVTLRPQTTFRESGKFYLTSNATLVRVVLYHS